jgi:hypothetical protein
VGEPALTEVAAGAWAEADRERGGWGASGAGAASGGILS